jgi:hypothetical protein
VIYGSGEITVGEGPGSKALGCGGPVPPDGGSQRGWWAEIDELADRDGGAVVQWRRGQSYEEE